MFEDADEIAEWANNAIQTFANMGVIQGVGNNRVNPRGNVTRAEVATIRARKKTQRQEFFILSVAESRKKTNKTPQIFLT